MANSEYMLIDTHAHLYSDRFSNDRDNMINRALDAGVTQMLLPNIDSGSIPAMLDLEKAYPEHCYAMMGLHPTSVKENYRDELQIVQKWLQERPFIAVGEIGIDLHWDKTHVEEQKAAFLQQVEWALELDVPIVIHSRESIDLLIDLLQQVGDPNLRGEFHCFTGDAKQAESIVKMGFYLGIGGVLTFKNGGLDKTLPNLPFEYLILETDSPYLSPKPHRGKRNESAYVKLVAERMAEILDLDLETVARQTSANTYRLFQNLPKMIEIAKA